MNRPSPWARWPWRILILGLFFVACEDSSSILDAEKLSKTLDLTPVQSEIVSSHVRLVVEEVNRYLEVIRQREQELSRVENRRVNDQMLLQDPEVEQARLEAVGRIKQIAANIREELTPEQKAKFDQIPMPDLKESPQELAFMVLDISRGRFASMQTKTSTKVKPMVFSASTSDTTRYNVLKEQRTVILGEPSGKDHARVSDYPGQTSGDSRFRRFPIVVTATLIDSAFIKAEHRYTAPPDSIDGPAGQARLQALFTQQQIRHMLTIRIVLSTSLHESYIDMDRWAVYIEDQDGRPYEPAEITETGPIASSDRPEPPIGRTGGRQAGPREGFRGRPDGESLFVRKARQYDFLFSATDVYDNALIKPDTEFLQLVFFDKNDPSFRALGKWELK